MVTVLNPHCYIKCLSRVSANARNISKYAVKHIYSRGLNFFPPLFEKKEYLWKSLLGFQNVKLMFNS